MFNDTDPSATSFGIVDYSLVVQNLDQALRMPFQLAPVAAQAIADLERGNGSLIYQGSIESAIDAFSTTSSDPDVPFVANLLDTVIPILCGDSLVNRSRTLEGAREDYDAMLKQSPLATSWYPTAPGLCT